VKNSSPPRFAIRRDSSGQAATPCHFTILVLGTRRRQAGVQQELKPVNQVKTGLPDDLAKLEWNRTRRAEMASGRNRCRSSNSSNKCEGFREVLALTTLPTNSRTGLENRIFSSPSAFSMGRKAVMR